MKQKRMVSVVLIGLCAVCAALGACKGNNPSDSSSSAPKGLISSDWTVMPENTNENLKYFGYFHSDGFKTQGSYIDEIASLENSNVLMINSCFSNDQALELLTEAKNKEQKAVFSVHNLFAGGKVAVANSATLVENYTDVLTGLKTDLKAFIDDGTILGLYFDEPAWQGIKENDFRTVTKWIRDNIPSVKVMTTMTTYDIGVNKRDGYSEINASYNEYCTDVMYDSYLKWNDETRRSYLEKLKSKATDNQWIWGCATGFVNNAEQNDELYAAIKGMYTEAIQESRYAGIVSFSYANGLEADWGYGLHTFFDNSSEYYDADLKKLYTDIGREVIGLDPYDYSQTIDLTLMEPTEVYNLGETVELPSAGAVDGDKNVIDVIYTLTSPSGVEMEANSFVATESGKYTVTVTAKKGNKTQTKTCYICVRSKGEISSFDDAAYLSDAGGTEADLWCWPRQIDTDFFRTGGGALKVTPHPKDGTWSRVIFQRDGYQLWDISQSGSVSMWVYNTGDDAIEGFSLMVSDENISSAMTVYSTMALPSKEWTKVSIDVDFIKNNKPALDLTKVTIFYGNSAADYKNRSTFYIDDVTINEKEAILTENMSFETDADLARIGGSEDDNWAWPYALSTEQAHGGSKSLKITPHATDGTWPLHLLNSLNGSSYDLSNIQKVSVWVYFDSDSSFDTLGLLATDATNTVQMPTMLKAREWTEISFTTASLLEKYITFDLTKTVIKFAQMGATYANRASFYLDDFTLTQKSETQPTENGLRGYESATDMGLMGGTADDLWRWALSQSDEQAHTGEKSLKVTVRAEGGNWPNVVFKSSVDSSVFDITDLDYISFWVYFDSDADITITTFGFKINNGENVNQMSKLVNIPARQWTELKITKAEILAGAPNIDVTKVCISLGNFGSTYPSDVSNFYIDDFIVTKQQ